MTRCTYTAVGIIPHERHPNLGIWMPVKLEIDVPAAKLGELLKPKRRNGRLVFALPRGRECVKDW